MKNKINILLDYEEVEEFNIKRNGVQIIDKGKFVEIYSDIFRSIPIFITIINNTILVFSEFEKFYQTESKSIDLDIDKAGFWEIVLIGHTIGTRTLYKNIKQVPSASKVIVNVDECNYYFERYWDYYQPIDETIDSVEKAAIGLYEKLDVSFSKIDFDKKYIMGISGGMDSRITLAFLSKYINKKDLDLFTYGFDKRILEYKYACEISVDMGFDKPSFCELSASSYINSIEYLPKVTGGQIGINHCHVMECISKIDRDIIVTSYSEVIFSLLVDCNNSEHQTSIRDIVQKTKGLDSKIKNQILCDYQEIEKDFALAPQFSSISEYIYQVERHAKFHEYLSYTIGLNNTNINPYLDFDLLTYVMSIPNKYKCRKKLQDYILVNIFGIKNSNISSARFQWGDAGKKIDWVRFKLTNRVNALLRLITKGRIQLFNKYQTEEQERVLYENMHNLLKKSTQYLFELGVISKYQKKVFDRLPVTSKGIPQRFTIIGIANLLKK
jgi:hypothetical protein